MSFEMSRPSRIGVNLAASRIVFEEANLTEHGFTVRAQQGRSQQQMVQDADRLMDILRLNPHNVGLWSELAALCAQNAGDLHCREELDPASGDYYTPADAERWAA